MGRQIIQHPDGGFNIFSSICDGFYWEEPITEEQLLAFLKRDREKEAEEKFKKDADLVAKVKRGEEKECYFQFTLTYAEAQKTHDRNFPRKEKP